MFVVRTIDGILRGLFQRNRPHRGRTSTCHPFRLSERSHYLANWVSIVDRLPAGWDDDEFHISGTPYPWCETLSDDCDCHGTKGRLDAAYCSDFGLHEETDKRASKSRTLGTSTILKRWRSVLLAATSPEDRRGSKESSARRPVVRPLSRRSLLNEVETIRE